MGVYRAAIVTENGQNLIAQALANEKPLIFTSAKTSSYSYPVGTDVPALTGLQDVVQSVLPFDSKVLGGNVAQVSVRFDNDGVDQTYRIETIGLYAKIEGGAETLFSVTQATTPDEMPVQSDISPSAYIYNIQHTVQNASQITLTVNPAGTATVQDIMDIETPEFDDSGTVEGISSFPSFLETMKSKMNFFQFFRNLKAGLQFVLHAGQIVNNCVTDNAGLPLSAAQGKVLKDLYTQLYSESEKLNKKIVGDETWTALQAIDKAGINSLRVQIVPNDKNVYLYQTTTGDTGYKYVGRLVNVEDIGTIYWSNLESIQCTASAWTTGKNKITLPPGTYIICAHAAFEAGSSAGSIRVNGVDCVESWQSFGQSSAMRRVTVTFFYMLTQQTALNIGVWSSTNITAIDCEVCAMKIK